MKVSALPIKNEIKGVLLSKGITELYPPQAESIEKGLLDSENMVVAIPTASGKTLIAILAMLSQLEQNPGSKVVYLAPLRALASEKYYEFREFAQPLGYKVGISTGDFDSKDYWLAKNDIIIATNEKFDSIMRHNAEWLGTISCVVSDEVHLINDSHRGPVLEVVLAQVKQNIENCQIVALSATIRNAKEIAEWLGASLILSSWRPVSLKEGVWFDGRLFFPNGKRVETSAKKQKLAYVDLAIECVEGGGQTLVFCNSRKTVVSSASTIARYYKKRITPSEQRTLNKIASEILSSGEQTSLSKELAATVRDGVGFHHAGLSNAHRMIIERAYKSKQIKIITASPTLAAGVNLPGRRVLIRQLTRYSAEFGSYSIPVLEYKQMAGRAGRPGYDDYGESIIFAKNEREKDMLLERYIESDTEIITSKFGSETSLRSHLLSFIAVGEVDDFDSAIDIVRTTFYGYQNEGQLFFIEETVLEVLELLSEGRLISQEEPYEATPFGQRISQLYLDPLSAILIRDGLEKSKNRDDLLPFAYLLMAVSTPDSFTFYVRDSEGDEIIDVAEKYYDQQLISVDKSEVGFEFFLQRIKTAQVLNMWLEEHSEEELYKKYNVASGDIHSLLSTVEWLLGASLQIAKIFRWEHHQKNLQEILVRLKYGVRGELIPLTQLENIGRRRARLLYDAGFTSVDKITVSSLPKLKELLGTKTAVKLVRSLGNTDVPEEPEEEVEEIIGQRTLDEFF